MNGDHAALAGPGIIEQRLNGRPAVLHAAETSRQASVALILEPHPSGGRSILLIERARREGDPWSGQIAFPGGRREHCDADPEAVAVRETAEEIGLSVPRHGRIGRLDDLKARRVDAAEMVVSCFVYALERRAATRASSEIEAVLRLPLGHFLDPGNRVTVTWKRDAEAMGERFPGIACGAGDARVVWGLTYRFLLQFFERLGYRLPRAA